VPLLVLGLVLASAALHATWNLWTKQLGRPDPSGVHIRQASLLWLLTAISSVFYAPFAWATILATHWRPDPVSLALILGSGLIHVGYFFLLLRGYRAGDLSLVYPLARGTGPLLATAGAVALFHEHPTALSVTGALLVVAGVAVMTWRAPGSAVARVGPAVRYGLATGVAIAVYTLWDGWGVKRAGVPPLVFYWAGEVVRMVTLAPLAAGQRTEMAALWRTQRPRVIGIALLSPLSYILILIALRQGDVGHIAPAREVSILIGAWRGTHPKGGSGSVLGEGNRRRRLVASAVFAAGVIVLAAA
jgi:drug/metabolite transporter (DMT)-like permease